MTSYYTERLRLYNFKEDKSLANEIKRRCGNTPKAIKVYQRAGGSYEMYLRGKRELDLGKNVDNRMFDKVKKHFHTMKNKGSYAHVYKEADEMEEKRKQEIEAEKDERMRYMGKEYYKYGFKGSSGSKAPSVVVDGFKGK